MKNKLIHSQLASCFLLTALTACQPDYFTMQSVSPKAPEPTIGYRIKRKTATGNCYTNVLTEYEYLTGQLVAKEVLLGSDRGGGPPVQVYNYDANGRMLTSTYQLMIPQQDGATGFASAYTYTSSGAEKRTDVLRGGQVDNTNYNLSSFQYTIVDGVTLSAVESYKEQDGRPMKAYYKYIYANGNLTRWTVTINNNTVPANDFTYTYDDKPNPFKGRGLPIPTALNGRNNVVRVTAKYSHIPQPSVNSITYTYNEKGYPATMLNGDGCSTQFEYETY